MDATHNLELRARLQELKELGAVGVKAEFEAEGARAAEIRWLAMLALEAKLDLGIKIGGCEAVTDLRTASEMGARYVIAPMVETAYALSKYLQAIETFVHPGDRSHVQFLINIETAAACAAFPAMLAEAFSDDITSLSGIVIGRVDLVGSLGIPRSEVNSEVIYELIAPVVAATPSVLDVVIGGGVSPDTLPFLARFAPGTIDRCETRKIIFGAAFLQSDLLQQTKALRLAVDFELAWLTAKRTYYQRMADEDLNRLKFLQARNTPSIVPAP